MHIKPINRESIQPIDIDSIEKKYSGRYIGDFCIKKNSDTWTETPLAIFYNPTPLKPEHSNYFGIMVVSKTSYIITNGASAFCEPIVGVVADDGEVVYSRYRHDYVVSSDNSVFIDGGRDYCRSSGSKMVHLNMIDGEFKITEIN